jgi:hypothetical protein
MKIKKCRHTWEPNFDNTKSIKRGYVWRCFRCGCVRKTTPQEMK